MCWGYLPSLLLHGLAHAWGTGLKKGPDSVRITLWLLGDASRPLMNALLAALGFLLYLLQFNSSFSAIMTFLSVWNAALVVYNMTPGFI